MKSKKLVRKNKTHRRKNKTVKGGAESGKNGCNQIKGGILGFFSKKRKECENECYKINLKNNYDTCVETHVNNDLKYNLLNFLKSKTNLNQQKIINNMIKIIESIEFKLNEPLLYKYKYIVYNVLLNQSADNEIIIKNIFREYAKTKLKEGITGKNLISFLDGENFNAEKSKFDLNANIAEAWRLTKAEKEASQAAAEQ